MNKKRKRIIKMRWPEFSHGEPKTETDWFLVLILIILGIVWLICIALPAFIAFVNWHITIPWFLTWIRFIFLYLITSALILIKPEIVEEED